MMTKTHNTVSENTLMNVEQALHDGKPKTGPEIAKAIKRDYTTVYRALSVLGAAGKVDSVKHGRFKLYFTKKETKILHPKIHVAFRKVDAETLEASKAAVEEIQKMARQYLEKNGSTPLVDLVRALPYPRSSAYAAVAEMRRVGGVEMDDQGSLHLVQPTLVVPGPTPVLGTKTADLPKATNGSHVDVTAILAQLVQVLTERALTDALESLVEAHPETFQKGLEALMKEGM